MSSLSSAVVSGPLLVALVVAALAGLVSFLSPCVLPLVPGYLSYVTGLTGADLAGGRRGRVALGALLFVLGFSVVFVLSGLTIGWLGSALVAHSGVISQVLGVVTIGLGLAFMGVLPGLRREWRIHARPSVGLAGAPLLGVLFGIGWTPCLGPTLTAIVALAFDQHDPSRGAVLAVAYCLGLGIPFLVAAVAFRRAMGAFSFVKRHYAWVMRLGGGLLVVLGLLLVTGLWTSWMAQLQNWTSGYGTLL